MGCDHGALCPLGKFPTRQAVRDTNVGTPEPLIPMSLALMLRRKVLQGAVHALG
jgi:hypothetical protein